MNETITEAKDRWVLASVVLIVGVFVASVFLPLLALPGGLALLVFGFAARRQTTPGRQRAAAHAAIAAGASLLLIAAYLMITLPIVRMGPP